MTSLDTALRALVDGLASPSTATANTADEMLGVGRALPAPAAAWAITVAARASDAALALLTGSGNEVFERSIRRATEIQVIRLLSRLYGERQSIVLTHAEELLVREAARRNLPHHETMRGMRRTQEVVLDALLSEAEGLPAGEDARALTRELVRRLAAEYDEFASAILQEQLRERVRLEKGIVAKQRQFVASLMTGEEVPLAAASEVLGVNLRHTHLAVVFTSIEQTDRARRYSLVPDRMVGELATAIGAESTLAIPDERNEGGLVAWFGRHGSFGTDYMSRVRERVVGSARVVVGTPHPGPGGFRRSCIVAQDAERIVAGAGGAAGAGLVVDARDLSTLALLGVDAERAGWFVEHELGALAAGDEFSAQLRSTVLAYLACGCSLVATAARLHLHRNTVVYRLQRAEEALGHPVAERLLATHAALSLAAVRG